MYISHVPPMYPCDLQLLKHLFQAVPSQAAAAVFRCGGPGAANACTAPKPRASNVAAETQRS